MILNGHQFEDKFSRELSRYLKLRNERYNLEAVKKKEKKKKKCLLSSLHTFKVLSEKNSIK